MPTIEQRLLAGSLHIREAATKLTERVMAFEAYLNQLKGRVETQINVLDEHGKPIIFGFSRDGSTWRLWFIRTDDKEFLSDGPLVIKMLALKVLPDLLFAMELGQTELVKRINQCVEEFDKWFPS